MQDAGYVMHGMRWAKAETVGSKGWPEPAIRAEVLPDTEPSTPEPSTYLV